MITWATVEQAEVVSGSSPTILIDISKIHEMNQTTHYCPVHLITHIYLAEVQNHRHRQPLIH